MKIDLSNKTIKDAIDLLGFNRAFSIVMEYDFTYSHIVFTFRKDRHFIYLMTYYKTFNSTVSKRINLDDPFDEIIEVYPNSAYDKEFKEIERKVNAGTKTT